MTAASAAPAFVSTDLYRIVQRYQTPEDIETTQSAYEFAAKAHADVRRAELVDGVTKLAGNHFTSRTEAAEASFQKMMIAMTQDYRVVLIKLADRLHNMRTLGSMPAEKKRRIANETLQIHAPLAEDAQKLDQAGCRH